MKIGIIIPARIESKRLPGKVLIEFFEMSMIQHVWERANLMHEKIPILIATDSDRISMVSKNFGADVIKTKSHHKNALSRVQEVNDLLKWDHYIVLQADEMMYIPKNLEKLHNVISSNSNVDSYNTTTDLKTAEELSDKNIVKCTIKKDNSILLMHRKPWSIAEFKEQSIFTKKICGVYSISSSALKIINDANQTKSFEHESIEQLNLLEVGLSIKSLEIKENYPSINTIEDKILAEKLLLQDETQSKILNSYINGQ